MKKSKILLILICLWVLGTIAYAESLNSLRIYKLVNEKNTNFVLPEIGDKGKPNLNLGNGIKPIADSDIAIYLVEKKDKGYYDKMSTEELGKPYQTVKTDKDGMAYFQGLPDGIYYVRDLSNQEYIGTSILIELPYKKGGELEQNMNVYLKSTGPGEPPETPPPENPPPGEQPPPGNPPTTPPENPTLTEPNVPDLYGRKFLKTDNSSAKKPLAGATFKVVEKKDGKFVPILKNGVEYIVKSDSEGKFHVSGIGKGEFYLVETIAPTDGNYKYKLLNHPLSFKIDEKSHELSPIRIENAPHGSQGSSPPSRSGSNKIPIPKTGDIQIILYLLGGSALFISGLYIYITEIRKKELWH